MTNSSKDIINFFFLNMNKILQTNPYELLNCFSSLQYTKLEKLISKNYFLNQSAKEAFKAYVRAYDSHQLKAIFEVATLDLKKVALSFGFTVPPVVDLSKFNHIIFNSSTVL